MAQFDIHENANPGGNARYPYLIDLQCDFLSALRTRVLAPMRRAADDTPPLARLNPVIEVAGESYVVEIGELAGIAGSQLGPVIGNAEHQREELIAAIDFVFVGF